VVPPQRRHDGPKSRSGPRSGSSSSGARQGVGRDQAELGIGDSTRISFASSEHSRNSNADVEYASGDDDMERPSKRIARHRSGGHAQRRGRGRASGKGDDRRYQQRSQEVHNIASAEDIVREAEVRAAHPKMAPRPKGGKGKAKGKGEAEHQGQEHTPALQHNIISLLVSLAVVGARTLRELTGVVFVTFLIDTSTELVKQMAREGQKYYEATVGVQDHQLGPPHVHVWAAMIKCLRSMGTSPASALVLLEAYWQNTIMLVDRLELEEEVKYCRVRKCWQRNLSRLQFSLSPMARTIAPGMTMTLEQAVNMCIKEAGGTRKRGAPPRSALEREADSLLLRYPRQLQQQPPA
jgi:hypothetical protein